MHSKRIAAKSVRKHVNVHWHKMNTQDVGLLRPNLMHYSITNMLPNMSTITVIFVNIIFIRVKRCKDLLILWWQKNEYLYILSTFKLNFNITLVYIVSIMWQIASNCTLEGVKYYLQLLTGYFHNVQRSILLSCKQSIVISEE